MPEDQPEGRPHGAVAVARRAPFSDNPKVGARGQRTQQRILDAALRAFGEEGYRACSVDRITSLARCSRVSFYQYFASKEEAFRQLAGQVARQLSASTEALEPLTPDIDGWAALRAWVARYAEIYARYEPVFHAYETDEHLAAVVARTGEETVAKIRSRLVTTTLPPRQLAPVVRLLLECMNHAFEVAGILRSLVPANYPSERVEGAVTDVLHRTLFGPRRGVNVRPPNGATLPDLEFSTEMWEMLQQQEDDTIDPEASGTRALAALLASARGVFVSRGYHNTRIDDLVAAAGISHGAFYRYFRNKDQLTRILTARAVRAVGPEILEMPDISARDGSAGTAALRRWLRRYNAARVNEAAMMRVWLDASLQDPALRAESASILDWGRRRFSRYLRARGFGDIEMEAVVMVALFGVFGARQRGASEVEAAAHIIEQGLLGRSTTRSESQ